MVFLQIGFAIDSDALDRRLAEMVMDRKPLKRTSSAPQVLAKRAPIADSRRRRWLAAGIIAPAIALFSQCALADEGGVSFWVPGFFGSLAAAPQQPGWSLAT